MGEDRLLGQEGVFFDARVMAGRLCTVLAVLSTAAAAPVDDRAEVDVLAAEMLLEQARAFLQFRERCGEEDRESVSTLDAAAGDNAFGEFQAIGFGHDKTSIHMCVVVWDYGQHYRIISVNRQPLG